MGRKHFILSKFQRSKGGNNLYIKKIVLGELATNCYILGCSKTREAAVIDPAIVSNIILEQIKENGFQLKYIINTHGHADHIGGNKMLKDEFSANLLVHKLDEEMLIDPKKNFSFYSGIPIQSPPADQYLEDGMHLKIGLLDVLIIHTPGHSPGSVSIKVDNKIFTGDTLFREGIGRTDLPGGSNSDLTHSIKDKLFVFDASCEIFPGHGPETTLKWELENNPWLK